MPASLRPTLSAFVAALLLSLPLAAFQSPLSDESIREAYFLGQRNDQSTVAFFTPYLRQFDRLKIGPYISEVEIYTPFGQLVELASRRNNYSAQQATLDYHSTEDTLFVRVRIQFTPTYGTPRYFAAFAVSGERPAATPQRADFSHDFRFGLSQNGQWIEPLDVRNDLTNTLPTGHFAFDPDGLYAWVHGGTYDGYRTANGWLVWLQFDLKEISLADEAQVEITGPGDQHIVASFDLGHLR